MDMSDTIIRLLGWIERLGRKRVGPLTNIVMLKYKFWILHLLKTLLFFKKVTPKDEVLRETEEELLGGE